MPTNKPLKRHPALHHLSHDHHHGLLLCWKIRQAFKLGIEPQRVRMYCEWFWENHFVPHFEEEEKYIFPILTPQDPLVKQALGEHRQLRKLFTNWENPERTLGKIEEKLEQHIRFEERVLFAEIQKIATDQQLESLARHGDQEKFTENMTDPFWIA